MEQLQRELHVEAVFDDAFDFDPAAIGPVDPTQPADLTQATDPTQVTESTQATDPTQGTADPTQAADQTQSTDSTQATESTATDVDGLESGGDTEATPSAGDDSGDPPLVAGVDQAFTDEQTVSAVVVCRGSTVVERVHAAEPTAIPYIPGLLSFREGGPILSALAELETDPDLYLFDGSGRIHFRGAGLATHLGVTLDAPAVGVAKSLLCGRLDAGTDGRPVGWREPVTADADCKLPDGTVLGYAYQSRQYERRPIVNPVYVSPGHRVGPETAVELVARTCAGYKLPKPIRLADSLADEAKANYR